MSTLNRFQPLTFVSTGCSDPIQYSGVASIVLGGILVIFGLLSIALGIGAICTAAGGFYIAYGIWCGFLFCVTGIICMVTGCVKNAGMVVTTLVFCMLAIFCGAVQFSIGIVATNSDSIANRQNKIFKNSSDTSDTMNYYSYDIFNTINFNAISDSLCAGPENKLASFNWDKAWAPVDVLLLLTGFICLVAALAVSGLTCHSFCSGTRFVENKTGYTTFGGSGFGNEGYDPRMSPQILKVAP